MTNRLYVEAVKWGIDNDWLNPKNEGQSRLSIYLGKPVRALARFLYGIPCTNVLPAVGVMYHLFLALDNRLLSTAAFTESEKEVLKKRAWNHLMYAAECALVTALAYATLAYGVLFLTGRLKPVNTIISEEFTTDLAVVFSFTCNLLHISLPLMFAPDTTLKMLKAGETSI